MKIKVPEKFDPSYLSSFQNSLEKTKDINEVEVDFSPLKFSKPIGMLVAGSLFRRWIEYRRESDLKTTHSGIKENKNVHSYLMHLGFFDFITMKDVGKKIGVAKGNTKYLPIKEIKLSDLEKKIQDTNENLLDAIIFLSDGLANVLCGTDRGDLRNGYSYLLREIIRNALEHSESGTCFICGQRWVNGQSEIVIVDEGVGVSATISSVYDVSDEELLLYALKPGVTRTINMKEDENIYGNSGYGLYVLSELGRSFGWFCIGSGEKKLLCNNRNNEIDELKFDGTFVGVHFNSNPKSFSEVVSEIIEVGEKEAGEGTASAISQSV